MILTSSVFENGGIIPPKYTCDGDGVNPPLEISNVPKGTKSLALMVEDPDAPSGLFIHWMVWNIPPTDLTIENGVILSAVEGLNSSGERGWKSICPPNSKHRYYFRVYALDTEIYLDPALSTREDFIRSVAGHIIDQCELMGMYNREESPIPA